MYLGHLIYLSGLSLTLQSWFAAAITICVAIWFHIRVVGDEKKLANRPGLHQNLIAPLSDAVVWIKLFIPLFFLSPFLPE